MITTVKLCNEFLSLIKNQAFKDLYYRSDIGSNYSSGLWCSADHSSFNSLNEVFLNLLYFAGDMEWGIARDDHSMYMNLNAINTITEEMVIKLVNHIQYIDFWHSRECECRSDKEILDEIKTNLSLSLKYNMAE